MNEAAERLREWIHTHADYMFREDGPRAKALLREALAEARAAGAAEERERIRAVILAERWTMNWFERPLPDGSVEATLDTERFAASILDAEADHDGR